MVVTPWEMKEGKITSVKYGENVFNLKEGLNPDSATKEILKKIDENLEIVGKYLSFVDVRIEKKEIVKEIEKVENEKGEKRIKYMRVENAYQKMFDAFGEGIFSRTEADKLLDRNSYIFIRKFLDNGKIVKVDRGKFKFVDTKVKLVEDIKYKQELMDR